MDVFSTLLIAFSMPAGAIAVAAGKGMALKHPQLAEALWTEAIFGAVASGILAVGYLFNALFG